MTSIKASRVCLTYVQCVGWLIEYMHIFFEDVEMESWGQKSTMARPFLTVLQQKTVTCNTHRNWWTHFIQDTLTVKHIHDLRDFNVNTSVCVCAWHTQPRFHEAVKDPVFKCNGSCQNNYMCLLAKKTTTGDHHYSIFSYFVNTCFVLHQWKHMWSVLAVMSHQRPSGEISHSQGGKDEPYCRTDRDTRRMNGHTAGLFHQRPVSPPHYDPSETHTSSEKTSSGTQHMISITAVALTLKCLSLFLFCESDLISFHIKENLLIKTLNCLW